MYVNTCRNLLVKGEDNIKYYKSHELKYEIVLSSISNEKGPFKW